MKIEGNMHMRRTYAVLPNQQVPDHSSASVGIIGCGNFAYATIGYYLQKNYGSVIRGVMDIDADKAASLAKRFKSDYHTTDSYRLLDDEQVKMVFIASNHASHAEYAIEALKRGKHVHIEKPHVVDRDQLDRLTQAMTASAAKVALGFNRPDSVLGRRVRESLASEPGASMMNWFVAGHEIAVDHWYFDAKEGGRILGNLCHWTDFVYQMVDPAGRYPLRIVPARSVKSDCDIAVSYIFGDGTIAVITFSAKGHTFEGVRERFSAHRGDILVSLDDFKTLVIEKREVRSRKVLRYRDHGHENRVTSSYEMSRLGDTIAGCTAQYVWEAGDLFLATKQALEEEKEMQLFGAPSLPACSSGEEGSTGSQPREPTEDDHEKEQVQDRAAQAHRDEAG